MAYLDIHTRHGPVRKVKLTGPAVIGRALGADLVIDDPELSRRHFRIEPRDNARWAVIDLDSTNGTFISGTPLLDERVLGEGDKIEAGHTSLVFREGEFLPRRPSDPIEAASKAPAAPTTSDLENTTLVGQRLPQVRVMPPEAPKKPKAAKPALGSQLPFQRPPARPIVKDETGAAVTAPREQSSRWLDVILSRFRGGR